jgi:hypothetical protein
VVSSSSMLRVAATSSAAGACRQFCAWCLPFCMSAWRYGAEQ